MRTCTLVGSTVRAEHGTIRGSSFVSAHAVRNALLGSIILSSLPHAILLIS